MEGKGGRGDLCPPPLLSLLLRSLASLSVWFWFGKKGLAMQPAVHSSARVIGRALPAGATSVCPSFFSLFEQRLEPP